MRDEDHGHGGMGSTDDWHARQALAEARKPARELMQILAGADEAAGGTYFSRALREEIAAAMRAAVKLQQRVERLAQRVENAVDRHDAAEDRWTEENVEIDFGDDEEDSDGD